MTTKSMGMCGKWRRANETLLTILNDSILISIDVTDGTLRARSALDGVEICTLEEAVEDVQEEDEFFVYVPPPKDDDEMVFVLGRKYDYVLKILKFNNDTKTIDSVREEIQVNSEEDVVIDIAISKSLVATVTQNGQANVHYLQGERAQKPWLTIEAASCVAISPDERMLFVGGATGKSCSMWSIAARACSHELQPFSRCNDTHALLVARFSPDGRIVAGSSALTGEIYLWDAKLMGSLLGILRDAEDLVIDFAFSPNSAHIIGCIPDGEQQIVWDLHSGDRERLMNLLSSRALVFKSPKVVSKIREFLF
ncbi:MAG: WD40 repeat domain-containing protein [Undibacterium sp.]|nr:WD40 repeat domain-containing protein [Opitutaceae bacterium]